MADEARAMLDALMGADRNASLPAGAACEPSGPSASDHHRTRRKRSCYDPAVCPLYCVWGVDLHELFTNTKSDIGPNPRICDDDAREEYLGLPQHEQERLGFEYMLYDRLRDLVRGCDRTVSRNKDKLRQEVARQQRARGGRGDGDDPAANISEDRLQKVAENMARVELLEEDIGRMVQELEGLDEEERKLVGDTGAFVVVSKVADGDKNSSNGADANGGAAAALASEGEPIDDDQAKVAEASKETNGGNAQNDKEEKKDDLDTDAKAKADADANSDDKGKEADASADKETKGENDMGKEADASADKETKGENDKGKEADASADKETKGEKTESKSASEPGSKGTTDDPETSLDDESKAKLADIRAKKRAILSTLPAKIQQVAPLRDTIEAETRHLHFFRSNHTIDKCVCEVSGNFMSFRDADERIAAHYAGKQYVGWKMVRDKHDELKKKFGNGPPPPPRGGGGYDRRGPPPGYGPPPSRGGGGGYRDDHRRGGGGGGGGRRRDRSRSRSRERDRHRDRHRGGRRRSPDRWERDRAPRDDRDRHRGGGRRDRW